MLTKKQIIRRTAICIVLFFVFTSVDMGAAQAGTWTMSDGIVVTGPVRLGRPCGWYCPSETPIACVNVQCPAQTLTVTKSVSRSITWAMAVGGTAGINWGPIKATIEASLGITIGQTVTITVSQTFGPYHPTSKEVTIWPRYDIQQFTITLPVGPARKVNVANPNGWYVTTSDIKPVCSKTTSEGARYDLESYRQTLGSGILRDLVDSTITKLDHTIYASINYVDYSRVDFIIDDWTYVTGKLVDAVAVGGDQTILAGVMINLANSTDGMIKYNMLGVLNLIDDPDDPEQLPDIPSLPLAMQYLDDAREAIANTSLGTERFNIGFGHYNQAYDASIQAAAEQEAGWPTLCCLGGTDSVPAVCGVGGVWIPVDKLALLAPYVGLASTIMVATVATAIYVKRVKRRKEKQ